MRIIDINADMGEYADNAGAAIEAALMPYISSCSIACGGHAGDGTTMRATARLAHAHDVSIGAHPSYPDREGFGRRSLSIEQSVLRNELETQIKALVSILTEEGFSLSHVKPHGALYNDAAKDIGLARLVANIAPEHAILVGPAASALEEAATECGLRFAAEGFVDRLYQASGALTPRSTPGAIIASISARAAQARAIAEGREVAAADGHVLVTAQTLCIHSDSFGAVETAKAVRAALEEAHFVIRPLA